MSKVTVAHLLTDEAGGPIYTKFVPMETRSLQGPYLHAAYLMAMKKFEVILIRCMAGFAPHHVDFLAEDGKYQEFKTELSLNQMREIVLERIGDTVELPVKTHEIGSA